MSKRGRPKKGTVKTKESTKWTNEEDEKLRDLVSTEPIDWDVIAEAFPNKTKTKCAQRWAKILNPILKKGPWSNEEDDKILSLVEKYGAKKWSFIASHLNGRVGKQCRERWHNHLNPVINKEPWSEMEDELIIEKQKEMGNKWSKICTFLNGRTDNMVKNRWNSTLKRKLSGNTKTNKKRNIKANTEVKAKKQKVDIKKFTTPRESTIKKELDMESPTVDRRSENMMEDEEGYVEENIDREVERTPERTHLKFEEMEADPQTPLSRSLNNNNGEFNLFSTPKEDVNTEQTFVACVYSGGNEVHSPSILYKKEQETNISMPQSPQVPSGFSFSPQLKTNTPQPQIKVKMEPFSPSLLFGTPVSFKESHPVHKESLLNSSDIQNKETLQSSNSVGHHKHQQKPRNKSLLKQSFKNKYNSILEGKSFDSPNNTPLIENNSNSPINNINNNNNDNNVNNNNNENTNLDENSDNNAPKISGKISDSPNFNSPNINNKNNNGGNNTSNEDFSFNTPNNTFKTNNNNLSLTPYYDNNLFASSPNLNFDSNSPLLLKELHTNSPFGNINVDIDKINMNGNSSNLGNNQLYTSSSIINSNIVRKTPFSELFSPNDFPSLKNEHSSPLQVLSDVSTSPFRYISPESTSTTPGSSSKKNIFLKLKCEESILPSNGESSTSNQNNVMNTPNHHVLKPVGSKTPNSVNGKLKFSVIDNIHVKPNNRFTLKFVDSDDNIFPPSPNKVLVNSEPTKPTSLVYTLSSNKVVDQIDKNSKDVMYKRAESLVNPHVKLEQKENLQNSMI